MDDLEDASAPDSTAERWPFSAWWPAVAGLLTGMIFRLIYLGAPGDAFAPMNSSFMLLVPLAVGAVTVYVAERSARRSWRYYIVVPALANLLFIGGTMLCLIEGVICAIIAAPLFALVGAVGGLLMGVVCRIGKWPRHTVYCISALPLVLGAIPPGDGGQRSLLESERSIMISATPAVVWRQLHDTRDIQPGEVGSAWMYRIGVPLPIAGVTRQEPSGLVRTVTMGKSIHFEQVATEWERDRYVRWRYRFQDDSFPAGALDDHVKIGGHYFDLADTEYLLADAGNGQTRLTVRMHYRVNTQFDWYARPVGSLLIGNFEDVILKFYRGRAVSAGLAEKS